MWDWLLQGTEVAIRLARDSIRWPTKVIQKDRLSAIGIWRGRLPSEPAPYCFKIRVAGHSRTRRQHGLSKATNLASANYLLKMRSSVRTAPERAATRC